jgi:hypothetical protein
MNRMEIILNRAITQPLLEQISKLSWQDKPCYTVIKDAQGSGHSGLVLGDSIWPELNDIIILYVPEELTDEFLDTIHRIREFFPLQGLAVFSLPGVITY